MEIQFDGDTDHYYILYRSLDLGELGEQVEMLIGQSQKITQVEQLVKVNGIEEKILVAAHSTDEPFNTSYK